MDFSVSKTSKCTAIFTSKFWFINCTNFYNNSVWLRNINNNNLQLFFFSIIYHFIKIIQNSLSMQSLLLSAVKFKVISNVYFNYIALTTSLQWVKKRNSIHLNYSYIWSFIIMLRNRYVFYAIFNKKRRERKNIILSSEPKIVVHFAYVKDTQTWPKNHLCVKMSHDFSKCTFCYKKIIKKINL